jgi:hypothetical protein
MRIGRNSVAVAAAAAIVPAMKHPSTTKKPYEPPVLRQVGSLHDLTLRNKAISPPSDGDFLSGQPLRTS